MSEIESFEIEITTNENIGAIEIEAKIEKKNRNLCYNRPIKFSLPYENFAYSSLQKNLPIYFPKGFPTALFFTLLQQITTFILHGDRRSMNEDSSLFSYRSAHDTYLFK